VCLRSEAPFIRLCFVAKTITNMKTMYCSFNWKEFCVNVSNISTSSPKKNHCAKRIRTAGANQRIFRLNIYKPPKQILFLVILLQNVSKLKGHNQVEYSIKHIKDQTTALLKGGLYFENFILFSVTFTRCFSVKF
jgi:hypothetical protein